MSLITEVERIFVELETTLRSRLAAELHADVAKDVGVAKGQVSDLVNKAEGDAVKDAAGLAQQAGTAVKDAV